MGQSVKYQRAATYGKNQISNIKRSKWNFPAAMYIYSKVRRDLYKYVNVFGYNLN